MTPLHKADDAAMQNTKGCFLGNAPTSDNVSGVESDMLDPRAPIEVDEFLNMKFFLPTAGSLSGIFTVPIPVDTTTVFIAENSPKAFSSSIVQNRLKLRHLT